MYELKSNSTLQNGKYRILQVLGQGGYGITYLAENVAFGVKVAIKEFFLKDIYQRDETSNRISTTQDSALAEKLKNKFLHEAKRLHELDHPNIVAVSDFFEENDTSYFVMDYIEGRSLRSIVKSSGPLKEETVMDYISQVANALKYIHSKKITHLDVKPDNIIIRESDNKAFIIDFGISKKYDKDDNVQTTTPVGVSRGFAPIEQYDRSAIHKFTPKSDVYALGATLYYALTGISPMTASDRLAHPELDFPVPVKDVTKELIRLAMIPSLENRMESVLPFISSTDESKHLTANTKLSKCNTASWNFAPYALFLPLIFALSYVYIKYDVAITERNTLFMLKVLNRHAPLYALYVGGALLLVQLSFMFIYKSRFSILSTIPTLLGIALPFLVLTFFQVDTHSYFNGDTSEVLYYNTEYALIAITTGMGFLIYGGIRYLFFNRIKSVIISLVSLVVIACLYSWKYEGVYSYFDWHCFIAICPIIAWITLFSILANVKFKFKKKEEKPVQVKTQVDDIEGTVL